MTAHLAALFDGIMERPAHDAVPAPSPERETLKSYKRVLADGTGNGDALIRPFGFRTPDGWRRARSAGLEGFLEKVVEPRASVLRDKLTHGHD